MPSKYCFPLLMTLNIRNRISEAAINLFFNTIGTRVTYCFIFNSKHVALQIKNKKYKDIIKLHDK